MPIGGAITDVSYNGFTFNETTMTEGLSCKPKMDQAGRTIAYVVYSFVLSTILKDNVSATCNSTIESARRKLLVQGKAFRYKNTGFGDIEVNVSESKKDVMWGPKVTELSYEPYGVNAARLVWKCEVCLPECSNAVTGGALMEFNYKLAFDQDRQGFTTRTMRGYFIIPLTRKIGSDRSLGDSADAYWDNVLPALPDGFRRDVKNRELDEAKNRIDFTVVDEEMGPNILPPGITDCRANHQIESMDRGFYGWVGTINADYEIARDYPEEKVYVHFVKLCEQRIRESLKNMPNGLVPGAAPVSNIAGSGKSQGIILPLKFSFGEPDIYGRPGGRFSLQYMIVNVPFISILRTSSVWMPVGNDWNVWKTSLQNSALHPRGNAKLKFNPADDVIIDLCLNRDGNVVAMRPEFKDNRRLTGDFLSDKCPSKEDSWLFYDIQFEAETRNMVAVHKPLPITIPATTVTTGQPPGPVVTSVITQARIDVPNDIVQQRTSNEEVVYVTGRALRACYDIAAPELKSISGRPAVVANGPEYGTYFVTKVVGTYGHTVIAAWWRHRYVIPSVKNQRSTSMTSMRPLGTPINPRELSNQNQKDIATATMINDGIGL